MSGWNLHRSLCTSVAATALFVLPAGLLLNGIAQQHIETSTFNSGPARPKDDSKTVAKGKQLYGNSCESCHSADLRGTERGPNLLRSQDALTDTHGENLVPVIRGERAGMGSHKLDLSVDDANAVAAYVRSQISLIGSQGRPPGEAARSPNILVGNAEHGKQYFAAKCANCHSVDGDLKGLSKKIPNPKTLQAAWLRGNHFGVPLPTVTVTVTEAGKPKLEGVLIHVDDFLVTLKIQDGSMVTVRRRGALPKVEVHDPLEAHRNLLPVYTDNDIHDVTAYMVTLK